MIFAKCLFYHVSRSKSTFFSNITSGALEAARCSLTIFLELWLTGKFNFYKYVLLKHRGEREAISLSCYECSHAKRQFFFLNDVKLCPPRYFFSSETLGLTHGWISPVFLRTSAIFMPAAVQNGQHGGQGTGPVIHKSRISQWWRQRRGAFQAL